MNDGNTQALLFCKDCAHFANRDGGRCLRSPKVDLVTGETSFYSAATIRTSSVDGDCGPTGIFWQPKGPR